MKTVLEPEILSLNSVMKARVLARLGGKIIYADTLTVDSSRSRRSFAQQLAKKTGETPANIELELLALLNRRPAPPPPATEGSLLEPTPEPIRKAAEAMLRNPKLLGEIQRDISRLGVVGDGIVSAGLYVAQTSRLLSKPLAVVVRGATSAGKSLLIKAAASLTPPEAKLEAHHISAKALYYLPNDALVHKVVIAGERRRRQDDETADCTKALREMLSDGVLRASVTRSVGGRIVTAQYEKPGPIAYIESTSAANSFAEDMNRMLVLYVNESQEQTERIIKAAAKAAVSAPSAIDEQIIQKHHAAQRMLKSLPVVIPYAELIADRMPTAKVEARRAMLHLLNTIKAVALLRQFRKGLNHDGAIEADHYDYAVAVKIVAPTIARLGSDLDIGVRRVWDAILRNASSGEECTRQQIAFWAGCSPSDTNGRVRILCELGLLVETREHMGNTPAKFKLHPDRPKIDDLLPTRSLPASLRKMGVS